jgi:hypothetical protein
MKLSSLFARKSGTARRYAAVMCSHWFGLVRSCANGPTVAIRVKGRFRLIATARPE